MKASDTDSSLIPEPAASAVNAPGNPGAAAAAGSAPPAPETPPSEAPAAAGTTAAATSGLARAAGINSLGNVASRLLGLVRETVVAGTFGVSGATSSFDAISNVPKMIYELLVGGMLSAALVPVLSEYAVPGRQKELERILSVLLSLVSLVMIVVVALLEVLAPQVALLLLPGFKNDPQLLHTAVLLVRLIVPSIFLYGLSGILQAYHYARQKFVYPAMGAPAHNLGVILAVLLLAGRLDVASLSVSIVVAAASQLVAQLPGPAQALTCALASTLATPWCGASSSSTRRWC